MTAIEFKEGDIYHWRYKRDVESRILKFSCDAYWCKSCIGVVKNGLLSDTYWGYDKTTWTPEEADQDLELTYVANFDDLEKKNESAKSYYEDADCVNLNHQNSTRGNFYIRKGAKKSRNKMIAVAKEKRERELQTAKLAQRIADDLAETIRKLESGADLEGIWL
jgi:hypothetical protein